CRLEDNALDGYAQHSQPEQCPYSELPTHPHTVNPLIAPHVNPFLSSSINTVSVLFFFSTDHCIGVTGDVSDTKSVPPSIRMPAAVLLKVTDCHHY
ncbi:unnamed protein product, partial [Staurois parvus]